MVVKQVSLYIVSILWSGSEFYSGILGTKQGGGSGAAGAALAAPLLCEFLVQPVHRNPS